MTCELQFHIAQVSYTLCTMTSNFITALSCLLCGTTIPHYMTAVSYYPDRRDIVT
jgi:ABC-type uncharacterized transport system fused permease/ATPase subunit